MRRLAVVAFLLGAGLIGPGRTAAAEDATGAPAVAGALDVAVLGFIPYAVVPEVSAEIVLGDRVAVGGKALFAEDDDGAALLVPYVAVGTPRSRSSAGYVALAWLPRTPLGTLGVGYEGSVGAQLRLYGEIGFLAAIGDSFALGVPYGRLGVRFRF